MRCRFVRFRNLAPIAALAVAAPALADEAAAPDGNAVYAASCAKCHGPDGRADTPVGKAMKIASLLDAQWASEDAVAKIEAVVRDGVPRMPPMGSKLSPAEIAAVARAVRDMAAQAQ